MLLLSCFHLFFHSVFDISLKFFAPQLIQWIVFTAGDLPLCWSSEWWHLKSRRGSFSSLQWLLHNAPLCTRLWNPMTKIHALPHSIPHAHSVYFHYTCMASLQASGCNDTVSESVFAHQLRLREQIRLFLLVDTSRFIFLFIFSKQKSKDQL